MSDPFKDFLEELERRRSGGQDAARSEEGEDGGGAPPRAPRARRPSGFGGAPRGSRRRLGFTAFIGPAILTVFLVGGPLVGLLTDARWYESLGASALFWQRLQLQGSLFAVAGVVALAFLIFNLMVPGALSRGGVLLADGADYIPNWPIVCGWGLRKWIEGNRATVVRFCRAMAQAADWLLLPENREETLRLVMTEEKLSRARAEKSYGFVTKSAALNPIAIVVPCHRVIGSNAALTGYAGGLARKRWLLAHEAEHCGMSAHRAAA